MPFIHRRSLQTGEEEQIGFRRRDGRALVCPPLQVLPLLPLQATTPLPGVTRRQGGDVNVCILSGPGVAADGLTETGGRVPARGSPGHDPVDAEGVEPVERQREAHHRHDDRDGRDEVAERRRGGRLDADEVCAEVDVSIQDAASSKVTLGRWGGGHTSY